MTEGTIYRHLLTSGGFTKNPIVAQNKRKEKIRLYQLNSLDTQVVAAAKSALLQEINGKKREYKRAVETFENDVITFPYLLKKGKTLKLLFFIEAAQIALRYGCLSYQRSAADVLREVATGSSSQAVEAIKRLASFLIINKGYSHSAIVSAHHALKEVAVEGKPHAAEAIKGYTECLLNPKINYYPKIYAADALRKVAAKGKPLPIETIQGLKTCLLDPESALDAKNNAADAFGEMVAHGRRLPEDVISDLAAHLLNPKGNYHPMGPIARALGKIEANGKSLPIGALEGLEAALFYPDNYFYADSVIEALQEVACKETLQALMATNKIIESLFSHTPSAAKALGKIAAKGGTLPSEAIEKLSALLFAPSKHFYVDEVMMALQEIAGKNTSQSLEAAKKIIDCFVNPKSSSRVRKRAAKALEHIASENGPQAAGVINELTSYLLNPQNDDYDRSSVVEVLGKIAHANGPQTSDAIKGLTASLLNGRNNEYTKGYAAEALGQIAASGKPLPSETINRLIGSLLHPQMDDFSKIPVAYALAKVATEKAILPDKILKWLVDCLLESKNNDDARKYVFRWLVEKNRHALANDQSTRSSLLHLAAALGHVGIGDDLIQNRPEMINSLNENGLTPLDVAKLGGQTKFVAWLTSVGGEENQQNGCIIA